MTVIKIGSEESSVSVILNPTRFTELLLWASVIRQAIAEAQAEKESVQCQASGWTVDGEEVGVISIS